MTGFPPVRGHSFNNRGLPIDSIFNGVDRDQERYEMGGAGMQARFYRGPDGELWPRFERVIFTSNGTFDKADYPWAKRAMITAVGGGGGGAGAAATSAGQASAGGGGGSGAYSVAEVLLSAMSDSETVTIGAGGAGGSGASNGVVGGDSSFGAHCVAKGGFTGGYINATASFPQASLSGSGGQASAGTGDIKGGGNGGTFGLVLNCTVTNHACGGGSGGSVFGGGSDTIRYSESPRDGDAPGAGGSGVANIQSQTAKDGGDGADGIVIVDLFAT
jgi:hypothetical protein